MDDSELELLLADLESDRSERTTSTTDTDKFGEAMCAFANDLPNHRRPGYLFVGAKPDGAPSGASITDQLLQNLALIRAQGNLLPQPTINVEKRWLRGGPMAVIEVLPSDLAPIRYKGRVWVRVGPARDTSRRPLLLCIAKRLDRHPHRSGCWGRPPAVERHGSVASPALTQPRIPPLRLFTCE